MFVQFRATLSVIANLSAVIVLFKKVNLSKSNVQSQNNDISSSISVTLFIFPGVGGIASEKNCVYQRVFKPGLVLSILETDGRFVYTESL